MAIIKACNTKVSVKNTGKECDTAMGATAMLIAVDPSVEFDDTDLEDPVAWLSDLIHQRKAFPIFGQKAPIRQITNNTEQDVIVTLDDGLQVFMRYGIYNRKFATTSGGLCYANSLQSFLNSGFYIIEIDKTGLMLARRNNNRKYGGLITDFMYAPMPDWADFKNTPYKNYFQISYDPQEVIKNGIIFTGASALLSMMGLVDTEFTTKQDSTTTKLYFGLKTECKGSDLVNQLGVLLANVDLYKVVKVSDGSVVTPASAAIVNGEVELTGVFTNAAKYKVIGTSPETWKSEGVTGYDASESGNNGIEITI